MLDLSKNSDLPHGYYPRPQLVRDSYLNLNGEWDFDFSENFSGEYGYKITVPFCPESEASGLGIKVLGKPLSYRRFFALPEGFNKGRVILHFGAVDQICRVYINGKRVGAHEGGYIPFSFDITDALAEGKNELSVQVYDDLDHRLPWGKQREDRGGMWYTPVSGIWQTVWLESVPDRYITSIRITPMADRVELKVFGGEEHKVVRLSSGEVIEFDGERTEIVPSEIHPWSPEEPYLYEFTLRSGDDEVKSYFAIRTVEVMEVGGVNRICLNGKPYLFNGLLDQGYFPDGIYTPSSVDAYIKDIKTAKSLGFNMLRKHIKIEPQVFYYLCDRLGIAVFQDMVNNGDYSFFRDTALPTVGIQRLSDKKLHKDKDSRRIFLDTMSQTAELLYNCPSVVYYTIFNEGWGQFSADEAYRLLKGQDRTRIIDATSGWFRQKESDVDSRHIYFKRLKVKRPDGKPLVISEFGGYSYRVPSHVFGERNYGYKTFKSAKEFEDAVIRLFESEVAPLVRSGASAFVYTQISDVEDETNGFLTYDREVLKVDAERLRSVMEKIYKN